MLYFLSDWINQCPIINLNQKRKSEKIKEKLLPKVLTCPSSYTSSNFIEIDFLLFKKRFFAHCFTFLVFRQMCIKLYLKEVINNIR